MFFFITKQVRRSSSYIWIMRKRRRPISREMRGEEVVSKRFCGDHLKKLGEAYAIFNMMALQKSPDLYTGRGVNSSALRGKGFFYKGNVKNVELEIGIPHCTFEAVMVDFLQGRMERVVGIMRGRGLFLICQCWYMRDPFKMFPLHEWWWWEWWWCMHLIRANVQNKRQQQCMHIALFAWNELKKTCTFAWVQLLWWW